MSLPDYIHYKNDLCYGDSDPDGNLDTGNRPHKGALGNLTTYTGTEGYGAGTGEHDKDGDHMSGLLALFWKAEPISWTGNTADDRDISLADATLDVKFIRVWEASTAGTWFRSENMAGDLTGNTSGSAAAADYVQSVGTGTFQVGTALNVGSRVYYAIVYGV